MSMTMTQKILAAHAGVESVKPGELIRVEPDLAMAHDVSMPVVLNFYESGGFNTIKYPDRLFLVMDHFTPCKDIKAAENCRRVREFAQANGIKNFIDGGTGNVGICHAIIPERGFIAPGEVAIGGDSHTTTYGAVGAFSSGFGVSELASWLVTGKAWLKVPAAIKFHVTGKLRPHVSGKDVMLWIIKTIGVSGALYKSMEFSGPGVANLSMDARFTIANMAIEAGAKNGIFPVDDITREYLKDRVSRPYTAYEADEDAEYDSVVEVNLDEIEAMVAFPHLPENGRKVKDIDRIDVKQVFIGSCTNGRLSDIAEAAKVLEGHKVADGVRVLVTPATPAVFQQALELGYVKIFAEAGCVILPSNCAACGSGHMGILGKGERALTTTNRNFRGRMGHIDSEIYLASPATAAATAIKGYICRPEDL